MRAPTACISRSGRRTPGASRWSATSTTGTAAAIRCATARDTGIWEIFIPDIGAGPAYKYEIIGADGGPAAAEGRPVRLPLRAAPGDRLGHRARRCSTNGATTRTAPTGARPTTRREPISIYEVHAGSWQRRDDGTFLSWDELADRLIPYVVDIGFTHIEFLPITEHPYDPSWGYQTTGLYRADRPLRRCRKALPASSTAPTAPASASSSTGCRRISRSTRTAWRASTAPRSTSMPTRARASIPTGTPRSTISAAARWSSFLVNNALYWAEKFHVDGLRVDAVASMLYLDYSRKAGEWIPNEQGGRENLEAVAFLQRDEQARSTATIPAS